MRSGSGALSTWGTNLATSKIFFAAFHHRVSDTGLLLKTERLIRDLTTELDTGLLLKTRMPTWSKRPESRLNMDYSGILCDKITRSRWVSFNIPPRHYLNSWCTVLDFD